MKDHLNPRVLKAIQEGLPLVSEPWKDLANQHDLSEETLLEQTRQALDNRQIKRFGLVVRHRKLGYTANAMVVWNIPDHLVDNTGEKMSAFEFVRLCYQRPRVLPHWPYNLFCMIHSKNRESALDSIKILQAQLQLSEIDYQVLFSKRCFKQTGAKYR